MFARRCSACARKQLVFADQVTEVVNTSVGILVRYTCWCGSEQSFVTGKAVEERLATVAVPVAA